MARQDSLQGSLPVLVLKILSRRGPLHGYGITAQIEGISDEILRVEEGSLYPALHRMEEEGWIKAKWAESETGRQAKFYSLTAAGSKQLESETTNWARLSGAINLVVQET